MKSIGKLPTIELAEVNLINSYQQWFDQHPEISRCVPPLYRDFVIKFRLSFSGVTHNYVEIVHYNDGLTVMDVCHTIDGKKVLTVSADYASFDGKLVKAKGSYPASTKYADDWLKNECTATVTNTLAVQAYILYHKPDIVPIYITAPSARRHKPKSSPAPRVIKDTARKFIRLSADDKPPRQANYRAIQWTVRGHYARYHYKDGTVKLKYIAPHIAKRGEKKIQETKIILK